MIEKVFLDGRRKLGWRRIKMHLEKDLGIVMNHKKIKRIMKKYKLQTAIRRRNPYKMIMKKTLEHRTCENILNRNFKQNEPGKFFCTDITYLYYGKGQKAYLSAFKDIVTKEIVSWELSQNITMKFVLDSLNNLINSNEIMPGALVHSDQGFHYTNPEFMLKIKLGNLTQSMSRKGNCIDNAPVESFFGHLKDNIECKDASNYNELKEQIQEFMKYYNTKRYQWNLKKMTPVQYRSHLLSVVT